MEDAPLRHGQIRDAKRIHEDDVGKRGEREDGPVHRLQRGLVDIDAVDFERIGLGRGPGHGVLNDLRVQQLALSRGDGFGVGDPRDVPVRMQHDGRRHDWTRETSAADFVRAGDVDEADTPQRVLQRARRGNSHHQLTSYNWQATTLGCPL